MTDRSKLWRRALPVALTFLTCAGAQSASAAPVAVNLRVEGSAQTIFDGRITTDGHDVTTASGGTHRCDGTNGGHSPTPGPVATAALDDGARTGAYTWDAGFNAGFDDFLIDRVGPDSVTKSQFWGELIDGEFASFGGCQQPVAQGDDVLWAFDAFSKAHALKLTGPTSATTGVPFKVRVTDGKTGDPIAGATIRGVHTNAAGDATIGIGSRGLYDLKAERADSIRSNKLSVCLDPAGAIACTSFDKAGPTTKLDLPLIASDDGKSRTLSINWTSTDPAGGSGVSFYEADVADGDGAFSPLVRKSILTRASFRGKAGHTYGVRVRGIDRARNYGDYAGSGVVIPIDDRGPGHPTLGKGWKRLKRKAAWGGRVIRARKKNATLKLTFTGTKIALVGRKLPGGGKLRIAIDGKRKVLDLGGDPKFRDVLYVSKARASAEHTLRARSLGGGSVELDAFAPLP